MCVRPSGKKTVVVVVVAEFCCFKISQKFDFNQTLWPRVTNTDPQINLFLTHISCVRLGFMPFGFSENIPVCSV